MDRLIAACLIWFSAAALHAQVWAPFAQDDGHFANAYVSSGAQVDFICNAPSQQGLTAWQAGAHETRATARHVWRLNFGLDRVPFNGPPQRADIILWVNQAGFRLPVAIWDEMEGVWSVDVPAADPLFAALARAKSFVVQPGSDPSWSLPVEGLAAALAQSRAACDAAWAAGAPPTGGMMARAEAYVRQGCGGAYSVADTAFATGLIDGDQIPDVAVWWGDIRCTQDLPRPFCGASHCSLDLFLSTKPDRDPMLALDAKLIPLNNGRMGIDSVGRFDLCGADTLGCRALWYWTPQGFRGQRLPEE